MRTVRLLLFTVGSLLLSCSADPEPLPAGSWAEGCVELSPDQGAYRLSGMCCEYIILPTIKLDRTNSFVSNGTDYNFTGAGFASSPVVVSGQLSADESTLSIQYSTHSRSVTHTLKRGKAMLACLCACY